MRALRLFWAVLAALCLAGCASDAARGPRVIDVRLADIGDPAGAPAAGGGLPSRVTLLATVENPSRGIKISSGRLRISYRGRRVVMLTLAEAVKIPPRGVSEVAIPLRVNVAHNSAALSLRAAVRRRDASGIGIETEVSARAGLIRGEAAERGVVPLEKAVPTRLLDIMWRTLDEFTGSLPESGDDE